jgi:hypothetical protein
MLISCPLLAIADTAPGAVLILILAQLPLWESVALMLNWRQSAVQLAAEVRARAPDSLLAQLGPNSWRLAAIGLASLGVAFTAIAIEALSSVD